MKFKINKEEYDKLGEGSQAMYVAKGDDYVVDVDITESDDYINLTANRDTILNEKKEEEKKRKALEDTTDANHISQLEKDKEYEKVLSIKSEKFKTDLGTANDKSIKLQLQLEEVLLNSAVDGLAGVLAGDNAELMKPHIRARLVMKDVEGEQRLFVTDATGSASAMTVEALGKEFQENKLYAPILQGRRSSGGGSDDNGAGGGGSEYSEWEVHFQPETRNLTKQSELMNSDKELYKKLNDKYGSSGRANMFRQIG